MWWGLRQPDQHVQGSYGRKEHARRKAQIACPREVRTTKAVELSPKSTEKLLSILSWRWPDQIGIFQGPV